MECFFPIICSSASSDNR